MTECIFCKIIAGEIPSEKVFDDQQVTAFRDIHPVAPTHILIIPNKHIASINELSPDDEQLVGHLFTTGKALAKEEGIDESGYRLIVNVGPDGGQEVYHLHLHLIGGQKMRGALKCCRIIRPRAA
jgi:histidine triad (HIT) family protein